MLIAGSLELQWSAPEPCPSVYAMRDRIGPLDGMASATVTATARGFTVDVRIGDVSRTVSASTCEEVAEAAVLIIQLSLQRPEPVDEFIDPPPGPPTKPRPTPSLFRFHLGGSVGTLLGWLPQPLVRFGIAFAMQRGSILFLGNVHTALRQEYRLTDPEVQLSIDPGAYVSLLVDASVGACWQFAPIDTVRLGPCGLAGVGAFSATGFNTSMPRTTVVAVPYASAGGRLSYAVLSWLELVVTAWARASSIPSVRVEAYEVVRASWFGGEFTAGLGGVF